VFCWTTVLSASQGRSFWSGLVSLGITVVSVWDLWWPFQPLVRWRAIRWHHCSGFVRGKCLYHISLWNGLFRLSFESMVRWTQTYRYSTTDSSEYQPLVALLVTLASYDMMCQAIFSGKGTERYTGSPTSGRSSDHEAILWGGATSSALSFCL
jgi:hypothetical protein